MTKSQKVALVSKFILGQENEFPAHELGNV